MDAEKLVSVANFFGVPVGVLFSRYELSRQDLVLLKKLDEILNNPTTSKNREKIEELKKAFDL